MVRGVLRDQTHGAFPDPSDPRPDSLRLRQTTKALQLFKFGPTGSAKPEQRLYLPDIDGTRAANAQL